MEFSRYLRDTQIPEWRRAYIDYRRLQAGLETIRGAHADAMGSFVDFDLDLIHDSIPNPQEKYDKFDEVHPFQGREISTYFTSRSVSETDSETSGTVDLGGCWSSLPVRKITTEQKRASFNLTLPGIPSRVTKESENVPLSQTPHTPFSPLFKDSGCSVGSPLYRMFSDLPTYHIKFFDMLDAELAKVDLFYAEREEEMYKRAEILRGQFDQLEVHRLIFQESSMAPFKYWDSILILSFGKEKYALDPGKYQSAQRRIREVIEEHYRCLEVLNNYRLLNLTAFREVLKTYAKVTNVSVLDVYMKEKIEPSAFGSGALVTAMVKETEYSFAKHFECGNGEGAISHLRVSPLSETYYFIILRRSALWFGLALPAIAGGSYLSFQESTRRSLPSWNILLYIYSILVVPVLLALLIGFNLLIWTRKRVNYAFILQLNTRSKLDYRAYYELPCFLLCTLAYAFWFSFAQIGNPTLWPLIWLVLTVVVMFNPVGSLMQGRARWWTIKSMANLWASPLRCVEFADVWLGDQMCSLVYSVSSLYLLGCFYTRFASGGFPSLVSSAYDLHIHEAWSTCSLSNSLWHPLLGMLPFMIRFSQCLRQYHDSKVPTNLVNAGKYAMGMIQYFCYCYWMYQAGPRTGPSYILMCFTATINSIYACTWDFVMDWAMFKPYARYPLLRPELVYKSQIPCYYFALLSNLFIRFAWVTCIYSDEAHLNQRAFIAALLEVLRRVQWNIYRLENSHLENTRQYRITRDLPLPYDVGVHVHADRELMV